MAKRKRASARPSKLRASARPSEKRASARKKAITNLNTSVTSRSAHADAYIDILSASRTEFASNECGFPANATRSMAPAWPSEMFAVTSPEIRAETAIPGYTGRRSRWMHLRVAELMLPSAARILRVHTGTRSTSIPRRMSHSLTPAGQGVKNGLTYIGPPEACILKTVEVRIEPHK